MYNHIQKFLFSTAFVIAAAVCHSQSIPEKLTQAYQRFESDSQLRVATTSLYVIDAKTGKVLFEKNADVGLATASTLKVITAATAYELLGKDFRYTTKFGYTGKIKSRILNGDLYIKPSGDPTLGSWRWKQTSDTAVLEKISTAFKKLNISSYNQFVIDNKGWNDETIPDGWIWQDVGNYYGAGASGFNWRENQYDIVLRSGSAVGDSVKIAGTKPEKVPFTLSSLATTAAKGTGDNAYVYYPLLSSHGIIRGTIPVNENAFTISASIPDPQKFFLSGVKMNSHQVRSTSASTDTTILVTHFSPPLDSIVYWFLKRSINLYGEALTKTFAFQKKGIGATDDGVEITRMFWKEKDIDPAELNIVDGSGLSPLNRVTTHAQVQVLAYAKKQPWFGDYFEAFPVFNDMKMKSGTIRGVKGFCGYQKARDGNEYIFSFLVNNYVGSASSVVQKMYKVLDILK